MHGKVLNPGSQMPPKHNGNVNSFLDQIMATQLKNQTFITFVKNLKTKLTLKFFLEADFNGIRFNSV